MTKKWKQSSRYRNCHVIRHRAAAAIAAVLPVVRMGFIESSVRRYADPHP